jgi:hypothetical protein
VVEHLPRVGEVKLHKCDMGLGLKVFLIEVA